MRHIVHGGEPLSFVEWKALENEDWHPSFEDLPSETKETIKNQLWEEQCGLCCYCEARIEPTPQSSHIEHYYPQSTYPDQRLLYDNLLLSCNGSTKPATRRCGHAKGNADPKSFVSPLDYDCQEQFHYQTDGKIEKAPHRSSGLEKDPTLTINTLNLNASTLVRQRKDIFETTLFLDDDSSFSLGRSRMIALSNLPLDNNKQTFSPHWSVWYQLAIELDQATPLP